MPELESLPAGMAFQRVHPWAACSTRGAAHRGRPNFRMSERSASSCRSSDLRSRPGRVSLGSLGGATSTPSLGIS
jgi:hypothetical protein